AALLVGQLHEEAIQGRRLACQMSPRAFRVFGCSWELAASRQLTSRLPGAGGVLKNLQLGGTHAARPQAGNGGLGTSRIAGEQDAPNLCETESREGVAEALGAALRRLQLLGLKQIAPRRLDVIAPQLSFAALDEGPRQL